MIADLPHSKSIPIELEQIKTIRRKITLADLNGIAQLLAKRITEQGACLILGIKPDAWYHWKQRAKNQARFEHILVHVRESQIAAHIDNIQAFQAKDWRASAELLRIKDPARFGQHQAQQAIAANQSVLTDEAMRRLEAIVVGRMQPKPVTIESDPVQAKLEDSK